MDLRSRLPDLLTTANLCCGVVSILLASQEQLTAACWLVFAGAAFDVLDGLAARALGGGSELGKHLDSLADMVTFGVAPAFALWTRSSELAGMSVEWTAYPPLTRVSTGIDADGWPLFPAVVLLVVASCWRLAKFNVDTRQANGFLGLPTPANGLFWVALVMGGTAHGLGSGPGQEMLLNGAMRLLGSPHALLLTALGMAMLMLSELPLPSLKFKHFRWRGNEVIYLLLGIGAVLVLLYGILAVPLVLIVYLLSPWWGRIVHHRGTENTERM